MRNLDLAVGGMYDIVTNSGLAYGRLRYLETLSVGGKVCMNFLTPDGRMKVMNLSYIAEITETEGGSINDRLPGAGNSSV